MTVKTVSKLVAKIGFNVDLSGLDKFKSVMGAVTKDIEKLSANLNKSVKNVGKMGSNAGMAASNLNKLGASSDNVHKSITKLGQTSSIAGGHVGNLGSNIGETVTNLKLFNKHSKTAGKKSGSFGSKIGKSSFKLSGFTRLLGGAGGAAGGVGALAVGLGVAGLALTKFIEKQAKSATQSQLQSAYYDIQQKQLLGLSEAYKQVGGNISTQLAATKQFQDTQGNLLLGKVNQQQIQSLAVSGSSSLINTLMNGTEAEFQSGVTKRYDFLRSQHTKYADRQANLLRQNFGTFLNAQHQQDILTKAYGKNPKEIAKEQNLLKYGTNSEKTIEENQERLKKIAVRTASISTGLSGIFTKISIGFAKSFDTKPLDEFIKVLKDISPIAIGAGEGVASVFNGILFLVDKLIDYLKIVDGWLIKLNKFATNENKSATGINKINASVNAGKSSVLGEVGNTFTYLNNFAKNTPNISETNNSSTANSTNNTTNHNNTTVHVAGGQNAEETGLTIAEHITNTFNSHNNVRAN